MLRFPLTHAHTPFSLLPPSRALATRIHAIGKRLEGFLWESDQLKPDHCTQELTVIKLVAKAEMVNMHSILLSHIFQPTCSEAEPNSN